MFKYYRLNFFFHFFILVFILTGNTKSFGQLDHGNFFVRNYRTSDYKSHSQNWDAVQDYRGIMYFANGDGVLEYDGTNWNLIPIDNESSAKSLAIDEYNKIFVGATNNFGFLEPTENGKLKFKSLTKLVSNQPQIFGTIKQIILFNKKVYFLSSEKIFIYDYNKITTIVTKSKIQHAFLQKNKFYIILEKHGVALLDNQNLNIVLNSEELKKNKYNFDIQIDRSSSLIGSRENGLFSISPENVISKNNFTSFATQDDNFLKNNDAYCGTRISNRQFVIGTSFAGAMIYDTSGKQICPINKSSGLLDNNICNIFEDKHNNLWFCLNKGISYVEVSGSLTYWNEHSGLTGIIENIFEFKNYMTVATHQGVFYKKKTEAKFKQLSRIKGQSWVLKEFMFHNKKLLLIGTNQGLWFWDGFSDPENFDFGATVYTIETDTIKQLLYAGTNNGLYLIDFKNYPDLNETLYTGINDNIRSIAFDDSIIWLTSFRNGVIRLNKKNNSISKEVQYYGKLNGFQSLKNVRVFKTDSFPLFASPKGIYIYENKKDSFIKYDGFTPKFNESSPSVYEIEIDKQKRFWYSALTNRDHQVMMLQKDVIKPNKWITKTIAQLPEMIILDLYADNDGYIWIGGTEGLFRYNPDISKVKIPYHSLIRKVLIAEDSVIFHGNFYEQIENQNQITVQQPENFIPNIAYKYNSISFHYASPFFENKENLHFQYKLDGLDENWSNPTKNTYKSYTNLAPGKYTFRIKSTNNYFVESNEAKYTFIIVRPWYMTFSFYLFLFLISIATIYLIFKLYTTRIAKKNKELEQEIQNRTEEIIVQNKAIIGQQQLLEEKNRDLDKLRIAVDNSSNAISIVNKEGQFLWINKAYIELHQLNLNSLQENCESVFDCDLNEDIINEIFMALQIKQTRQFEQFLERNEESEKIWLSTTISPIVDKKNNLEGLVFIDTDITSQKRAEHKIYQAQEEIISQSELLHRINSELSLLSIVATKTNNSIIIFNNENNIEWVNESFTKIRELSSHNSNALLKKPITEIYPQENIKSALDEYLKNKEPIFFEIKLELEKSTKWLHVNLSPVSDENTFLQKTIAIETDITSQKEIENALTRHNNEVKESLLYAAGIQQSMLPPSRILDNYFVEKFIFFKPKDIVSGDFYWFAEKNDKLLIAAADCTGHGIPGALMSMLGISLLQTIVDNTNDLSPNAILDTLRKRLITSLNHQDDHETRDGMDISLCSIDKKNKILKYSGANNPIYIIRDNSIRIIKADRMPIGIHTKSRIPFSIQSLRLQHNDVIYMFSDGYADQFGGPDRKKFLTKRFKHLLVNLHELTMDEQNIELKKQLQKWQGNMIQIDDILVLGFRF